VKVLTQQSQESSNSALQNAFRTHLKQSQGQISRIQQSFELLDEETEETECAGIIGLLEEHDRMTEESPSKDILDVFNVAAAIKVERYEISSYESLIRLADMLGLPDISKLLKQNLKEEEQTLKKMTTLTAKVKPETLDSEDEESEIDQSIRESITHLVRKAGSRRKRVA
jgi:ferritin-like metal-binding protein YciE